MEEPEAAAPDPGSLLSKARAFHERGNFIEAVPLYHAVLGQRPDDPAVLESLGLCQSMLGDKEAAVDAFRTALGSNPDLYVACNELAWLLATDPELVKSAPEGEAVSRAQRAVELTRGVSPLTMGTLAAAWAASADFEKAASTAERAVALAGARKQAALAEELGRQLDAYREGHAWRVARAEKTALQHVKERENLDSTVFAEEREAQRYETFFVDLWDTLLEREASEAFEVLGAVEFGELILAEPDHGSELAVGIPGIFRRSASQTHRRLDRNAFRRDLEQLGAAGWKLVETEWHHAAFHPATEVTSLRSEVAAVLHATNEKSGKRAIVRARLGIDWEAEAELRIRPARIVVSDYEILGREGRPVFEPLLTVDPRKESAGGRPSVLPLVVRDLDGDGLPEIILGGCNLVYENRGAGRFEKRAFLATPMPISPCGLVADFSGDGIDDFVAVGDGRRLHLWRGEKGGQFPHPPTECFEGRLETAQAMTAGDVDADGDLDLFIGQYLSPYRGGQMPTPWHDANDGRPAYLLVNDGTGLFDDGTLEAGLGGKRHRRSYSASLADLDADGDLDLVVVSDFAGLDAYLNDGTGNFIDVSDGLVEERHGFGMSHTFDDFNADGLLDFYMTGMGSTTARRLQRLGITPPGSEDATRMRMPMGYGNRMYLRNGDRFVEPSFKDSVARTGWSWGCASADFDNDGDIDIYVANGHISGKTTRDYCTRFWCHDIYTGVSKPEFALDQLFLKELGPTQRYESSWNGYEHNVLLLGSGDEGFVNVAFLAGCGFEFDARAVVGADLDNDGRTDLLVTRHAGDGNADRHELHVLRNTLEPSPDTANWIGFRFANERSVIGTRVTVRDSEGKARTAQVVTGDSFCAQHPEFLHFGLGNRRTVAEIEVIWPDGESKHHPPLETNRVHLLRR